MSNLTNAIISAVLSVLLTPLFEWVIARNQAEAAELGPPESVTCVELPPSKAEETASGDAEGETLQPEEEPPTPEPERVVEVESTPDHLLYEFTAPELVFRAYVLTQEFRWAYGSVKEVVRPSGVPVPDFPSYLGDHLSYRLRDASEVIAIGMSSCEGDRDSEEERARDRAETLKTWLDERRPDDAPRDYYFVNLGQFEHHDCNRGRMPAADTSDQRRIVVLFVIHRSEALEPRELESRIHQTLLAHRSVIFDPEDYSGDFVLRGS